MIETKDLPPAIKHDGPNYLHDWVYSQMLREIVEYGDAHEDRTGVGTKSIFGFQAGFPLSLGFPLLTTKKIPLRLVAEELRWFLLGRTDNQWLEERKVTIWREWATEEQCDKFGRFAGDLGPVYGHAWRHFGQTYQGPVGTPNIVVEPNGEDRQHGLIEYGDKGDQIKTLCDDLQKNPRSRRLIVSGWNPAEATKVALPPCHTMFQCKVREPSDGLRYLDLQLYQRSADSFLGVPFNIASYALLTHLLAMVSNMKPGRFIHTFGDLHIYTNHKDQVIEQLGRAPRPSPTLEIDESFRGTGFGGLMRWANLKDLEGIRLLGYDPHPAIAAPVAV